ncbi:YggU-like protein [Annulohypoxylon truncatum]|uniref:YggU-like protein n=1 Tax=Annulohypoxylon truncatum TaxID=327061 RepID=UPI002008A450|nr:YggU-like protein [Annulohypoxylon truncatum]KAI1204218.1 YggU-like protein [Annulohypoxylon truncatum]
MAARNAITLVQKSKASAPEILQLRCHIRPGASKVREGVAAVTDECIEMCVAAPPQDGKANKAVVEILSEILGVPKSDLQITHGMKNRDKTISIASACFRRGKDMEGSEDIVAMVRQKLLSQESS